MNAFSFASLLKHFVKIKLDGKAKEKFSDAGIQDISTSISINVRIQKYIIDLTERYEDDDDDDDDESDKHLEARDRRYSCLILFLAELMWLLF